MVWFGCVMMYGLVQLGGYSLSAAFYAKFYCEPDATYRTDFLRLRGFGEVIAAW